MGPGCASRAGRIATGAAVLAASLVAASCGAGGTDADEGGGRGADRVGIVPTKAAVIATVRLDRGSSRGIGRAREVLGRIPAWRTYDRQLPTAQDVLDSLEQAGAVEGLSWKRDVRPWLGEEGGAAGWGNPGRTGREAVGGMAWVEVADERRARSTAARAFGGERATEERGEVELHEGELADGSSIAWAAFAGRLVVATDLRALEASVDAAGGTSYEDRDDWERLSRPRQVNRGTTVARLVLTRDLFTHDTMDQLASSGGRTGALVDDLRALPGAGMLESDDLDGVALQVGAGDRGLWIDAVAVGELPVPVVETGALETLGRLPIGTVAGAATAAGGVGGERALERARRHVDELRDVAGTGRRGATTTEHRRATALADAVAPLLEDEALDDARDGWGDHAAVGILLDDGLPWLVAAADVDERGAADRAMASTLGAAGSVIGGAAPGSSVAIDPAAAGGGRVVVDGLARHRARSAMSLAGGDTGMAARIGSSPSFEHVFDRKLEGEWQTSEEAQLLSIPAANLGSIDASWNDGSDRLADDQGFAEGIEQADAPDDSILAFWIDSARLGGLAADTALAGRIAGVVKSQLSPLGGPLGWVELERRGDATVQRLAIELPIAG